MKTDPVNDFVASTVRRIRIEKGIRVADMARRTGIPLGSYSCLETGRYRMSLENLFRILQVLGTDVNQVWPGEISEWVEKAKAGQPRLIIMDDVLEAVAHVYDILVEDLRSPSRKRHVAEARKAAAVLVKKSPFLSLVELSRRLDRDVSSLSHALKRAYHQVTWDREMAMRFRLARRRLSHLEKSPRHKSLVTGKELEINLRRSEKTGSLRGGGRPPHAG